MWRLTERELAYGRGITRGESDEELLTAYDLAVDVTDVSHILTDLFMKLGVPDRVGAAVVLARAGFSDAEASLEGVAHPETITALGRAAVELAANGLTDLEIEEIIIGSSAQYQLKKARQALGTVQRDHGNHARAHLVARAVELGFVPSLRWPLVASGFSLLKARDDAQREGLRGLQIVEGLAKGSTHAEMREQFGNTRDAFLSQRSRLMRSLDVDEDWQLVLYALAEGAVTLPVFSEAQLAAAAKRGPVTRRILAGMGVGEPLELIAVDLGLPLRSIRRWVEYLREQLQLTNDAQLALIAVAAGLAPFPSLDSAAPLDVTA